MQRGFSCLLIMPIHTEQWQGEIGNFNGCLHHAIIKLKLNLFNIMTTISQVLVFLLAILHPYISKVNIVSCFFFTFCIMSLVASELTADTLCLCFKFRYFIKQIPTFYCLNSFNVISVISTGYVINLLLLLPQFIMDTEKVTLDQRKSTFITYRAATGMSIVYWLKMCLKFLKLYVS